MVSFFRTLFSSASRRVGVTVLAFTLLTGFILGAYIAALAEPSSFSLMRTASQTCVSITCLLPALLLPFLFTAFAVYISQHWLLVPIAFVKAFFFSYLSTGMISLFHSSGWLIQALLMFADCLSMPVLCWLWIRICDGRRRASIQCFGVAAGILLGIACLDYRFISPFLVNLLS